MSSFEYEGKNIDLAVQKACAELDLAQDEIDYQILSYGSSGIFGLAGAKKARILVNLPERSGAAEAELEGTDPGIENNDDVALMAAQSFAYQNSAIRQADGYPDDPLDLGREVLQRIVDVITPDAQISAQESDKQIFLNITASNAGKLIGKKGQTLEAIQSLVEKIVNRQRNNSNDEKIRVQVDVGGYRETRKDNLEKLAFRLAEKSKRTSKPISMGQMSAHDRRIVHLALKDEPGVRTKSRGEGYLRKLVIFPNKKTPHIRTD